MSAIRALKGRLTDPALTDAQLDARRKGGQIRAVVQREEAAARRAEYEAWLTANLRPGEKLIRYYCADCTECGCGERSDRFGGLQVTEVAEGRTAGVRYHRCIRCGAAWTARRFRWQAARRISLQEVA